MEGDTALMLPLLARTHASCVTPSGQETKAEEGSKSWSSEPRAPAGPSPDPRIPLPATGSAILEQRPFWLSSVTFWCPQ